MVEFQCVSRPENQEEPMFHMESEGRKKPISQFEGGQLGKILLLREAQPFCTIPLIIEAHPHKGGQSVLLSLLIQMC